MVQNAVRWEAETGRPFEPLSVDVGAATNVLVRWHCFNSLLWSCPAPTAAMCGRNHHVAGVTAVASVVSCLTRPPSPAAKPLHPLTRLQDRWICAASRSLTAFVREEMEAYR